MKTKLFHLLAVAASILLMSCSKQHQYTISNQSNATLQLLIHECNEIGDALNIQKATLGIKESQSFFACDDAVKLKIYDKATGVWMQVVYYLDGASTLIKIEKTTVVGTDKP